MEEKAGGQEMPSSLILVIVGVLLALCVFIFWYTGRPEGVKTAKPTAPNPPGGRIIVQ